MKTIIFLSIALMASSCITTNLDDDYRTVDPKLVKYIESFKSEAKLRGITIDDSRLKLAFGNAHGAAAVTNYDINFITIDSSTVNWPVNPEEIIYHEFGHLFLHRGHTDFMLIDTLGNSVPGSIMSTKASVKYAKKPLRRKYYVDELFNPKIKMPEWVKV